MWGVAATYSWGAAKWGAAKSSRGGGITTSKKLNFLEGLKKKTVNTRSLEFYTNLKLPELNFALKKYNFKQI